MVSSYILIVVILALALSSVAKRLHFSSELFLVIVMGAISFLPNIPRIEIDGHALLEIILPPLLFSAARNLSSYKFRKMSGPILYLGIGLIFVTALVVALFVSTIAGFMTFSGGLILGAVVAPPDAVSAVSIGKKLGLPERVMTILTGESLINDAAALTLFTFAVGMTYDQDQFISHPALLFAYTCGVGIGVGVTAGVLTLLIRKLLREPGIIAVFTAIVPFASYIGAEYIHGSGVLAVVVAGFIVERTTFRSSHATRLQEQSLWHSIETLLDSFVFAYIGLQMHSIVKDLIESKLDTLSTITDGILILLLVMLIRPVGVLAFNATRLIWYRMQYKHIKHFVSNKDLKSRVTNRAGRKLNDAPVSWREYIVLSWTGMRGVVTLAAASAVPMLTDTETNIDYQSPAFQTHIYIMVCGLIVAIGTLLIQGLTLPFIIKKILPPEITEVENDPLAGQWNKARQLMEASALSVIDQEHELDPDNLDISRLREIWEDMDIVGVSKNKRDISFMTKMLIEIVESQRSDMQEAARKGEIHPDVAREFLNRLDLRLASYTSR